MVYPFEAPDNGAIIDAELPRCGKVNYPHKRDAATARNHRLKGVEFGASGKERKKRHTPDHLREYYCEECEAWHLTHTRK